MADADSDPDHELDDLDSDDVRRRDGSRVTPADLERMAGEARQEVSEMWPARSDPADDDHEAFPGA